MRTFMLILASLALLGGGFIVYQWLQPSLPEGSAARREGGGDRLAPTTQDVRLGVLGNGRGAYATKFDRDTGRPMVRFRADEYQPQPDGRIRVTNPLADFFIGPQRQKICRIEANTGWVSLHGDAPRVRQDLTTAGPMQTPTRGDLLGVRIRYYNSQADLDAGHYELMLDLEHMSFDIETFRMATEAYVDGQGRRVEADDVPVQVRGESLDFDGKGLQLRWDDTDQKLEMLRVAKGGSLLIKKPGAFVLPGGEMPAAPAPAGKTSGARAFDRQLDGGMLAAVTRRPALLKPATTRRTSSDIFRATFHSDVKVTQAGQQLAQTPEMHVDFLSPNSKAATRSTPTTTPAPTRPVPNAAPAPASEPATAPKPEEPVLITWNGDFTVYPAPEDAIRPTTANDAVVRLVGSGTNITDNGSRIDCDEAVYHVAPKDALVRGSARTPARLTDAQNAVITSPLMEYSMSGNWAVLTGASTASIPTQQAGKTETFKASWSRVCTLHLTEGKHSVLETVELVGDVRVQHPQVPRFSADKLSLRFDPQARRGSDAPRGAAGFDATSSNLRHLEAEGGVDCLLVDAGGGTRSIRCETLKLDTENGGDGKLYPTRLEAHGKVVAGQRIEAQNKDQQIRAENLVASLVPQLHDVGSPEIAGLRDLVADGDVVLTSADGGKVQAEKIHLTGGEDGKPKHVRLEAKPGQMAMLARADRALWGNVIDADVASQQASVQGPGAMRLANPATPDKPAMPLDVTWKRSATVDGQSNIADIAGQVAVTFLASDGSTNNAWGESVHLDLAPVPGAKPRQGSDITVPADRFVKRLELRPATPQGEVQMQSLLPAADGSLIRQMNLLGPSLVCDLSQAGLERLTVPAGADKPGRLLYLDLTPADRKAAAVKPSLESQGMHGATAFAWRDKLVYDRAKSLVEMTGNVIIRHEPMNQSADSFEVMADRVSALLTQQADVGGRVPAAPKVKPEGQTPPAVLKHITLEGAPLAFKRQDLEFTAPRIDFEPITHLALARASDRLPVHVDKGASRGDFGEVEFNSETQMVKLRNAGLTGRK